MEKELDLSQVFKAVSKTLKENQVSLNEADTQNHNHGTNMVNTFKIIEKALKAKKEESASAQLAYASQLLREKSTSGSAMLYADGLENAAAEFQGKPFNRAGVGSLLNSLMGLPQSQPVANTATPAIPQSGDFLSTLIGGMVNNQAQTPTQPQPQPTTLTQTPDLIDALGGLTFTQEPTQHTPQQPAQDDPTDLVSALLGGLGQDQTPSAPAEEPTSGGLGGLLSGLFGGGHQQTNPQPEPPSAGGLGGLLGSLLGGQSGHAEPTPPTPQGGLSGSSLLSAALAYFMAKQQGKTPFEAILQAVGSATRFSDRKDHTQSGALVANTLIGMLSK